MRLSRSKCRIIGIQAGEASFNMLGSNPVLRVKFALLAEGGETAGFFEKGYAWSDRSTELLRQLTESLESDALPYLFEEPIQNVESEDDQVPEPPQI